MRDWLGLLLVLTVLSAVNARAQQRELRHERAREERRIALVIGNSAYTVGPLKNPVNDARAMTQALREVGFEVIHREDLKREEMRRAIREFGAEIGRGGVGLFYYAGHGVQVRGGNYLIPVDAAPESADEVDDDGVSAGYVLEKMEGAGNGMNIVILDACRNNPFARSFRSSAEGLAPMLAPSGTLVAYATRPGEVAGDGGNSGNGVYTQELLRYMRVRGLSIEEVFKRVRLAVRLRTQNKQTPWEESSLTGDFYFKERAETAVVAPPVKPPETAELPAATSSIPVNPAGSGAVTESSSTANTAAPARSYTNPLIAIFGEEWGSDSYKVYLYKKGKISEVKDKRKVFLEDYPVEDIRQALERDASLEIVTDPAQADFFIVYLEAPEYTSEYYELPSFGGGVNRYPKPGRLTGSMEAKLFIVVRGKKEKGSKDFSPRVVWQTNEIFKGIAAEWYGILGRTTVEPVTSGIITRVIPAADDRRGERQERMLKVFIEELIKTRRK